LSVAETLGPHSSQQLSYFIYQTLISKIASPIKLFFSFSHKSMSCGEDEKSSLSQLSPAFLSPIKHEAVGEAVLLNSFSKTVQLHL